jgi:prevent-host-death family protein
MKEFTLKQFQKKFDKLIERVENGETFRIVDGKRKAIITSYKDYKETEDLIQIYTDHEEGC